MYHFFTAFSREYSSLTQKFFYLQMTPLSSRIRASWYWNFSPARIICKRNTDSHIYPGTRTRIIFVFVL
jgi:hypothetical protein